MSIPSDFFAKSTQAEFISMIVDGNLLRVSPISDLDDMRRAFEAQGDDWAEALDAVEMEITMRCVEPAP